MGDAITSLIANYNPSAFAANNRILEAKAAEAPAQEQNITALGTQQAEQERLKNVALQRSVKDQEILSDAMKQSPGDLDQMLGIAIKNGLGAQTYLGTSKAILERRKELVGLDDAGLKLHQQEHEMERGPLNAAMSATNPADEETAWQQFRQMVTQHDPKAGQALEPTSPGKARMQMYDNSLTLGDKLVEEALKRQQTAASEQDVAAKKRTAAVQELSGLADSNGNVAPEDFARWQQKNPGILPAQASPDMIARTIRSGVPVEKQPEYDVNTLKARMGMMGNGEFDQFLSQYARSLGKTPAQLKPDEFFNGMGQFAVLKQDPQMRTLAEQQKNISLALLRVQQQNEPTQQDIEVLAKSMLDHSMAPQQFQEIKSMGMKGIGVKVFSRAKQLDPGFSLAAADSEFRAMEGTEKGFTSGKQADLVRSNNVALEHLGMLDRAREALANSDVQVMNAIGNAIGVQVGKDVKTTFDAIADRVGQEVNSAYITGGGGEFERIRGASQFNSKMSDTQLRSNIQATTMLMDSQQRGLQDQYKRGTFSQGRQELFTPGAMAARSRILSRGGTTAAGLQGKITVKAGDGSLQPFDTEQQAQTFEKLVKDHGGKTTRQ